jgi:ribosome-binding factor A
MTALGRRAERLAHQIRGEIAQLIARGLKDPRIGFTTVTCVELSHDLAHARVLVSVLGAAEIQQATLEGLFSAAGYIRHEIGQRLKLRRTPDLTFVLDHGAEESQKIEMLLQKLKRDQ